MNAAVKNIWPKEASLLLAVIDELIDNSSKAGITGLLEESNINWDRFKELIIHHELTPLVSYALKSANAKMPGAFEDFAKNSYQSAVIKCLDFWNEFLRIADTFKKSGISLVPLKGIALLPDIYESRFLRNMSDIDIVVREEDIQKAEAVLDNLGYKKDLLGLNEKYWRENQCHILFCKERDGRTLHVELHWGLDFKRNGSNLLTECWGRLRQIESCNTKITLLSAEDTLFSLALHARRMGSTLSLKNALDASLLLNKYGSGFDWKYCLDKSRKYRINSTLFFLLCQVKLISGTSAIPDYVWKGLKVPVLKRKTIENFINKNTFSLGISRSPKDFYLRLHFLLYDSWFYPVSYIINIPREQFAKYYNLAPYDKRTGLLYRYRLVYIFLKAIMNLFSVSGRHGHIKRAFHASPKFNH